MVPDELCNIEEIAGGKHKSPDFTLKQVTTLATMEVFRHQMLIEERTYILQSRLQRLEKRILHIESLRQLALSRFDFTEAAALEQDFVPIRAEIHDTKEHIAFLRGITASKKLDLSQH
ncbi:hypothetical protein CAPTEDRAFT_212124 [Capitella teleta]|uniref:Uncharacterized protein n=1 Tax=Capitella teleta TaxID=283909 RepID=R7VEU6_CAPTE|nr:hypothetical protein CAPTEDRAFT_212124 [Capitella teleta]|eukprot:ELU17373.1 hypothetical protein CAPTEDRAFT_212124 [Capitella teleta]